jgi:hypothetical protein
MDDVEIETSPDGQKTETQKENSNHDLDDRQDGAGASPREPLFAAVLREVAAERERIASNTLNDTSASRNFGYLPREVTADQVHLALVCPQ